MQTQTQTDVKTALPFKTFVLLPSMDSNAPIYQQLPDGKRSQLKKIPRHRPNLQLTFITKEGTSRTLRYKANANSVWQDEQIKQGLVANEKFTTNEYNDPLFKHGVLVTNKPNLIAFLLAHPECEGFEGLSDDVKFPKFQLVDKAKEIKNKNAEIRLRTKAANKILSLELKEAQELLIRLNGSFFETPNDVDECHVLLIDFLDNAEEAGVNAILKGDKDVTVDEKTTVLIGQLINAGLLSFDAVEDAIAKKDADGKWIPVRDLSSTEYQLDERKRLFAEFLTTPDGQALRSDLEKDLAGTTTGGGDNKDGKDEKDDKKDK